MPIVPQSPAAALFGFEVADGINKLKSMFKQMTDSLIQNGVAVTLPSGFSTPDISANKAGTPYSVEKDWLLNIQSAMTNGTHANGHILGTANAKRVKLSAIAAGPAGTAINFKVEAGSISGCKVTITDGVTPEVYDNIVATSAAIVAAVEGTSLLVHASVASSGDISIIGTTYLTPEISWTAPTFSVGEDDGQDVRISRWARSLWDGLVAAGYLK